MVYDNIDLLKRIQAHLESGFPDDGPVLEEISAAIAAAEDHEAKPVAISIGTKDGMVFMTFDRPLAAVSFQPMQALQVAEGLIFAAKEN